MPRKGQFQKGDPKTREAAVRGGQVRQAARRAFREPYRGTIWDLMDTCVLTGEEWAAWRVFLGAVFGLPLTPEQMEVFERHTERETVPQGQCSEVWMPVGRRGGKTRIAALVAVYLAIRFDARRIAKGESAVCMLLGADKKQAKQALGYAKGYLDNWQLRPYVLEETRESIKLHSGINIEVHAASFRTVRGFTVIGAVLDEIAFWRNEDSANPDHEVVTALEPAMATVPDALLLGMSSPYACAGELYRNYERLFGKEVPTALCWIADTRSMNPTVRESYIAGKFEKDPIAAAAEFGSDGRVSFRRDVEIFLDPEVVQSITVDGRHELPRDSKFRHRAFTDPSGGSQDSFTLAIAHSDNGRAVLDLIREFRPPFDPDAVVKTFCGIMRSYGISQVQGDRYAGEWPRSRFRMYGIEYIPSEKSKSDLYREFLPLANAGKVELLDDAKLRAQLLGLERRVARGGKDSIDHKAGTKDDIANAVAGAIVAVAPNASGSRAVWISCDRAGRSRWAGATHPSERERNPWAGLAEIVPAFAAREHELRRAQRKAR